MAEQAGGHPGAGDALAEVRGDGTVVEVMMVTNETELTQLAVKLAEAVNVDSGCAVCWEGARDQRTVLEDGG